MLVRVDHAGRDDLAFAFDHLRLRWGGDGVADFGDLIAVDEDVGVSVGGHMIVLVVDQDGAASEEDV